MLRGIVDRPGERDVGHRLWLGAFAHDFFDNARRRANAEVLPRLFAVSARQRRQVSLGEWLECRRIDVAHEDEREVARVGEPVSIDVECAFGIQSQRLVAAGEWTGQRTWFDAIVTENVSAAARLRRSTLIREHRVELTAKR